MANKKQVFILNYRVVVNSDTYTGNGKSAYTAYCPTLDVADGGNTIEEALDNIKEAIETTVEFLMDEGKDVPVDRPETSIIAHTQIKIKGKPNFAFV